MSDVISLAFPAAPGVNTSDELTLFSQGQVGRFIQYATGLRVENNRWHSAYAIKEHEITGSLADLDEWHAANHQAAIWYQPTKGQGNHYIGKGVDRIIETSAGKLWSITPKGNRFELSDISSGQRARADVKEAFLCQGENYVVRTDRVSNTQIYDGDVTVISRGYSRSAKLASRFPNKAGPLVYAGARFWVTLFDRRIYASDSLHQLNQVDASDLLKFTDQTYDFINVYFAGPSAGGDIIALTTTVDSGLSDSRAQGEVVVFEQNGSMWGIPLGIPRTQWPSTPGMRKPRSKETTATGQNAHWTRDGDILMRTPRGIESFNLLSRSRDTIGNPPVDLGADIDDLLKKDYEPHLRYASLVNPIRWNRMYCTVGPVVKGNKRYHKAYVTANWNPLNQRSPSMYSMEGIGTIPSSMGKIIKFLPVYTGNKSRLFALTDKGNSKGLVEILQVDGKDKPLEGPLLDKQWQLVTRRLTTAGPYMTASYGEAWVYLDSIKSDVKLELQYRTNVDQQWKPHRRIEVKHKSKSPIGCGGESDKPICLGRPLDASQKGVHWIQFRLLGVGTTSVDFALRASDTGNKQTEADERCQTVVAYPCDFDPYDPEPCRLMLQNWK
jgi:hypothetical protein